MEKKLISGKKMASFLDYTGVFFRKPFLFFRTLKGYLFAFLKSFLPPLHYLDIVTDYQCNLACQHCFAAKFARFQKKKLTLKEYQRLAKEAMELGAIHFSFQGGEVFLDKRIFEIIKAFQPKKNYISITTNGTLITSNLLKKLKKLGVDKLNFSLDSFDPKVHDRFRGKKGTFIKAMKALKMAQKFGFKVSVNTTVSHQNIFNDDLQKLFAWATKEKIALNPIFACPVGRWQENQKILLTPKDKQEINRWRKKSAWIRRDMESNWFCFGCPAVKEVLYITPDGEVLPCPFLHFSLGNVKKESLKKIRERGLKFKIFQKYHSQCLASENKKFLKKYLSLIFNQKLPLSFKKAEKLLKNYEEV
ncbi:MAG: radical SAM/SPASM domain-containing protein [Microgenomates group bacterium]